MHSISRYAIPDNQTFDDSTRAQAVHVRSTTLVGERKKAEESRTAREARAKRKVIRSYERQRKKRHLSTTLLYRETQAVVRVTRGRIPETIPIDRPIEETATQHLPITLTVGRNKERETLAGLSLFLVNARKYSRESTVLN